MIDRNRQDEPLVSANGKSEPPVSVGARVELTATWVDEEGRGVGRVRGTEVRAANVLPGERCQVQIEHVSSHQPRAWGRVTRRLSRVSPHRVTPSCPSFGSCGGCAWQHLDYDAQVACKVERINEALSKAGIQVPESRIMKPLRAPRVEGYRNVAKYVVARARGRDRDRKVLLGAYIPRTHDFVDMEYCRVVEPIIERIRAAACQALAHVPVYRETDSGAEKNGVLRYVAVRCGSNGQAVVAIVTTSEARRPDLASRVAQAARTLGDHPEVGGVVWLKNDEPGGVILAGEETCIVGKDTVVEQIAGVELDVQIKDFFQVNRTQAAQLYAVVTRLAGKYSSREASASGRITERVIDLYCGAGGFAFALARASATRHVLGIERNQNAVRAAQVSATRAALGGRVSFRAADASRLAAISAETYGKEGPDLVIVNPPRKGLDADTRASLHVVDPLRLIYVSCKPETLARDLAEFVAPRGLYHIDEIVPIDLMPGTGHVETVVALSQPDEP